jgi:phosphoribosylglycinamide formyltransferase 2
MSKIGVPGSKHARRVMLLGSGELGREVALELMRLGCEVVACDRYKGAPAMQVAHRAHVFNMLDAKALRTVVENERPDLIVPEIEALATDELGRLEEEGYTIIPNARAARLTMDREGIRRLASETLGLPTASYRFADTWEQFQTFADELGFPVVVKPIMSSSGKGQSIARTRDDLGNSWEYSQTGGRTGASRVILEEFIPFDSEITLLTVRSISGTAFCDPIGHRQDEGDYVESWQPHPMNSRQLDEAKIIARAVTENLGGFGLFGVELFLLKDERVLFSEVSPRPHDTGMVTMISQPVSEFALHARAILGFPVNEIRRNNYGASAAFKASEALDNPVFNGVERVFEDANCDLRIFSKPIATKGRRMAVVLATGDSIEEARNRAITGRDKLSLDPEST